MKFTAAENQLALGAALHALSKYTDDQPVPVAALAGLFDRPAKLNRTIRELERGGFILYDPYAGVIRLRLQPFITALRQYSDTPPLFPNEQPLDSALASVQREITQPRVKSHNEAFAPLPPKPPDPPPFENPNRNRSKTAVTEPKSETEIREKSEPTAAPVSQVAVRSTSRAPIIPVSTVIPVGEDLEKSALTGETGYTPGQEKQICKQVNERFLMDELTTLLGAAEMAQSGGHWRVDHVRQHPQVVADLCIQLRELIAADWVFKTNRAAWMEASIKKELRRRAERKAVREEMGAAR